DRPHRPDRDAGLAHVQDQPGDALVLRSRRGGPDQELAVVRDVAARAPDLLSGYDVVGSVSLRAGRQRCEVGARAGLREALTPDRVTAQDPGEVRAALLLGSLGDQRGPRVHQPNEVDGDVRGPGARIPLEVDELLGARKPPGA